MPLWIGGVGSGGGCACVCGGGLIWELSVLSSYSVPKTAQKRILNVKKIKIRVEEKS